MSMHSMDEHPDPSVLILCYNIITMVNTQERLLCVQDLTYTVRSHHNKKVELSLLTSISGFFNPGQMSALVSAAARYKIPPHCTAMLLFEVCKRSQQRPHALVKADT